VLETEFLGKRHNKKEKKKRERKLGVGRVVERDQLHC
jgi:hypothetical protein